MCVVLMEAFGLALLDHLYLVSWLRRAQQTAMILNLIVVSLSLHGEVERAHTGTDGRDSKRTKRRNTERKKGEKESELAEQFSHAEREKESAR